MAGNRITRGVSDIFLPFMFDFCEQSSEGMCMDKPEIEIIVDGEITFFSWNDEEIQELAQELGGTEFPEPRPCG